MRTASLLLLLAAWGLARAGTPVTLLSDLPDAVAAAASAATAKGPAAVLDAVLGAGTGYVFRGGGVTARTDTRWFEGATVEGPGAPVLELRRWPGDTVLAFYALPAEGAPDLPGLELSATAVAEGAWTVRDGTIETPLGRRGAVWCETASDGRRAGALGVAGDAGFGPAAARDLREEILAVVRRASLDRDGPKAAAPLRPPELGPAPGAADESKDAWQVFRGPGFTLGLPPGMRAVRLDLGVEPPRPMPGAGVWLRGRFTDRDGAAVAVGDGRRAGYVALVRGPGAAWAEGSAPPLGAPDARRVDGSPLGDLALAWTGASRAVALHFKEPGFRGDWLVFRLVVGGEGIEIGLPVLESWRSLALFWIPVTWRPEGRPPAPPPIDPAASRGIRFHRFTRDEAEHSPLLEGELFVADLRLEIPRGVWPVADMRSADGLPVTFLDASGGAIGRLAAFPAGAPELAPRPAGGWIGDKHARARGAAQVWTRSDGAAVLVAPDGHGFAFEPAAGTAQAAGAWRRLYESASFTKRARR